MIDPLIVETQVEVTCNHCGQYHGREVCEPLLAEIERLSAEVNNLKAILKETVENPGGDYYKGLNCGVEDRDIFDCYEAAAYGWDSAFDYIQSISNGD